MKNRLSILILITLTPLLGAGEIDTGRNNIAIDGYDPVGYHLQEKAIKGSPDISYEWKDALWYFSSEENRKLFIGNPEKYTPSYGGFCSNGLSDRHKVSGNPEIWSIDEGGLHFFFSERGRREWTAAEERKGEQADEYWGLVQFD